MVLLQSSSIAYTFRSSQKHFLARIKNIPYAEAFIMAKKLKGVALSGWLNLDKPLHVTSNDAVQALSLIHI